MNEAQDMVKLAKAVIADDVAKRMVDIDGQLSVEAMNWNHNLAHIFRNFDKYVGTPKLLRSFKNWNDGTLADWLRRGKKSGAIAELEALDRNLAKDVLAKLKAIDEEVRG